MKIISINLNSFGNAVEAKFNLNSHFTVIIGRNSSGKSTLLNAVQIAAGAFLLGLPNVKRKYIINDKITFVEATGYINDSGTFSWRQEITKYPKATSEKLPGIAQIKRIAATSAASLNNENRPMLPVIAFFGVKQLSSRPSARKV